MQSFIASIHRQECMTVVLSSETNDRSGNIKLAGKKSNHNVSDGEEVSINGTLLVLR